MAVAVGIGSAVVVAADPGRARLPLARRRPAPEAGDSALAGAAEAATSLVARLIHRRSDALARTLDLAGLRTRPQDFAFLVAVVGVALVAALLVLGFGWLALPIGAIAPLAAVLFLRLRIARRREAFASQLDGTLQLLASSLRAGYSTMQALGSVAQQSEEPSASELARVVNEARIGRPVVSALEEAAERMASEDFEWATQAIAINREVGGSLAETLDGVAHTIRERGLVRRQVRTLSSEGRLSAVILVALPFVVGGVIMLISPGYIAPLFQTPLGIALLVVGVVLMVIGSVWLHKIVEIKF
ncbi:type II secretion system F family protein [Agrococcus sp. SCSIO52902]|uniref:type II secretion system F family protein n=1 Tax=Agrococcus sp. SCSIO52902 TaxID=2933290 RepID=UPI001FF40F11|nr:type II secretion system F family protein [Agrococcus sp. SCSIO52902]UOW00022.1 type II secretion system F family protein [Agrococcus sp. SCSIO52902]